MYVKIGCLCLILKMMSFAKCMANATDRKKLRYCRIMRCKVKHNRFVNRFNSNLSDFGIFVSNNVNEKNNSYHYRFFSVSSRIYFTSFNGDGPTIELPQFHRCYRTTTWISNPHFYDYHRTNHYIHL